MSETKDEEVRSKFRKNLSILSSWTMVQCSIENLKRKRKDDLEALLKIEIQRRVKHFIFDFKVQARNGFAKTRV